MESYQNGSKNDDVVIDIPDDEEEDEDKCCFVNRITNWIAPPMYASLCVCGRFRFCEASNPNQHTCIVQLRFLCFWMACVCVIVFPLLIRVIV